MVFLGKYRVDEILGHGGMGVVAACTHLALNEKVAIKMLRSDVLRDSDAVERFMREAQAAVKLRSEYVARVSDVGATEDGIPYMVMEFLDGHDLGELIEQRGTVPFPWASELMLQAAEALAEAHSIGIVHRDVKPTNLFVTWRPDGSALIKVLDFGISKTVMGTDMQLTQTQSLLGTPAYMSPEQMRSARMVDARTDIWSLGTVLYELLEGRRPFEAESFSEMCVKVAVDAPLPMVNTPPQLQQVVLRCLAKSPEQRYSSMAELGRDLVPFAQDTHQAQMLVERMSRMLGRRANNSGDWDAASNTGTARTLPVKPIRDVKSGPVRTPAPAWHGGSDIGGQAYAPRTPAPGQLPSAVPSPMPREASVPTAYLPAQMQAPKRKPWAIVLGFAIVIAVGVGLTIALTGKHEVAALTQPATQPIVNPAPSDPDPAVDADKAAVDKAAVDKAAVDKAAADKAAADNATAEKAAVEPVDPVVEKPAKPDSGKPGKPAGHPPVKPTKPTKPTEKPKEVVKDPAPVKPTMDPFAAPRPPGSPPPVVPKK